MFFGALIVSACGGLMETGIRSETPVQRLAAAPIVVGGQQTLALPEDDPATLDPEDKHKFKNATLPERVRLDAALADRLRAVPGVTSVVGEVSFPAQIGAASALGHAWDSAVLTPYALSGQAPKPGEVVVDAGLAGLAVGGTLPVAAHGSVGAVPHLRHRRSAAGHAGFGAVLRAFGRLRGCPGTRAGSTPSASSAVTSPRCRRRSGTPGS